MAIFQVKVYNNTRKFCIVEQLEKEKESFYSLGIGFVDIKDGKPNYDVSVTRKISTVAKKIWFSMGR
ncbi:hypothetical protein [Chishuiella sp.]|uniref:hypothetical protein n=1 Tax=Chishuiella sp. TaxID=1969467 RepID=UPI0028B0EC1B|nr:hypothetical protein [Chishuiella sp.]